MHYNQNSGVARVAGVTSGRSNKVRMLFDLHVVSVYDGVDLRKILRGSSTLSVSVRAFEANEAFQSL